MCVNGGLSFSLNYFYREHFHEGLRVFHCLLVFYASDVSDLFVLNPWTLLHEMPHLPTFVACLTSPNVSGLGDLSVGVLQQRVV